MVDNPTCLLNWSILLIDPSNNRTVMSSEKHHAAPPPPAPANATGGVCKDRSIDRYLCSTEMMTRPLT